MTEQQGKHLDHRLRQALDSLPADVPAPGTSFDAGKLWEQLRPELPTQPVAAPRKEGQVRWLVAASLLGVGLLSGWLWWPRQPAPNPVALIPAGAKPEAGYVAQTRSATPPARARNVPETEDRAKRIRIKDADKQLIINKNISFVDPKNDELQPTGQPDTVVNVPAASPANVPAAASVPGTSARVIMAQKTASATYPKRRFMVVHQNELRAEAENRANLERNDRFVRWGGVPPGALSSGTSASTPADEKISLIIPLN